MYLPSGKLEAKKFLECIPEKGAQREHGIKASRP